MKIFAKIAIFASALTMNIAAARPLAVENATVGCHDKAQDLWVGVNSLNLNGEPRALEKAGFDTSIVVVYRGKTINYVNVLSGDDGLGNTQYQALGQSEEIGGKFQFVAEIFDDLDMTTLDGYFMIPKYDATGRFFEGYEKVIVSYETCVKFGVVEN